MQKQRRRSQENWVPLAPPCNTPTTIFRKDLKRKEKESLLSHALQVKPSPPRPTWNNVLSCLKRITQEGLPACQTDIKPPQC